MLKGSKETTSHMRERVKELLCEAKVACNRSLFEEITISNDDSVQHASKRVKELSHKTPLRRSWTTVSIHF